MYSFHNTIFRVSSKNRGNPKVPLESNAMKNSKQNKKINSSNHQHLSDYKKQLIFSTYSYKENNSLALHPPHWRSRTKTLLKTFPSFPFLGKKEKAYLEKEHITDNVRIAEHKVQEQLDEGWLQRTKSPSKDWTSAGKIKLFRHVQWEREASKGSFIVLGGQKMECKAHALRLHAVMQELSWGGEEQRL